MSQRADNSPNLDLKLELSPPRANPQVTVPPNRWVSSSETTSPRSSCVSSEEGSPEGSAAMMLVGCPRCLMYVMLSVVDPKCPKCKSTVLLDFFNQQNTTKTTNRARAG